MSDECKKKVPCGDCEAPTCGRCRGCGFAVCRHCAAEQGVSHLSRRCFDCRPTTVGPRFEHTLTDLFGDLGRTVLS